MKKQIILLAMMLLPMVGSAADAVLIDGIYYNLVSKIKEAEVTNRLGGNINGDRSYKGSVDIPSTVTYDGVEYNVTSIGRYAFISCQYDLISITIPNSVVRIGYKAFDDCFALRSVHISDLEAWCRIIFEPEVDEVYGNPYYAEGTNPLEYSNLFLNGKKISDLVIPNSMTSIGNYAFYNCRSLTSVTIPNSVTSIGDDAFYNCI